MNLSDKAKQLKENRLMLNSEQINKFEDAIATIFSLNNVEDIQLLCLGFDDKTEQYDVMFGLIHTIEGYDKEFGIEASTKNLLKASESLIPHATNWLEIILIRYLNVDSARNVLKVELKEANASSKLAVENALNRIALKDQELSILVKKILE